MLKTNCWQQSLTIPELKTVSDESLACSFQYFPYLKPCQYLLPRGVLRYISDGDVQSPFLGLKFAI